MHPRRRSLSHIIVFMSATTPTATHSQRALHAETQVSPLQARALLQRLVTETDHRLLDNDISGMNDFVVGLNTIRQSIAHDDWAALIADIIGPHSIRSHIHEEPFTRRAFEKPRGYPGDAPLLDLIYRDGPTVENLSPLGALLHAWAGDQPGCRSVQERRRLLATLIDHIATDRPNPRILSLACGHLREAQLSEAVRQREVEEFVAIDQDPESLALVEREQRPFNVTPVRWSVARFLAAPSRHGTFDLAYSAGLYDYLDDGVAVALTRALFGTLRSGGLLVVANFAPELRDIGYMEAIMDWKLIYRNEAAVRRFSAGIPSELTSEISTARDSLGNVIYLSVRKR